MKASKLQNVQLAHSDTADTDYHHDIKKIFFQETDSYVCLTIYVYMCKNICVRACVGLTNDTSPKNVISDTDELGRKKLYSNKSNCFSLFPPPITF